MMPGFGFGTTPVDAKSAQVMAAFGLMRHLHEDALEANSFQRDDAMRELNATEGLDSKTKSSMIDVVVENYNKSGLKIEKDFRQRERRLLKKVAGSLSEVAEGK